MNAARSDTRITFIAKFDRVSPPLTLVVGEMEMSNYRLLWSSFVAATRENLAKQETLRDVTPSLSEDRERRRVIRRSVVRSNEGERLAVVATQLVKGGSVVLAFSGPIGSATIERESDIRQTADSFSAGSGWEWTPWEDQAKSWAGVIEKAVWIVLAGCAVTGYMKVRKKRAAASN